MSNSNTELVEALEDYITFLSENIKASSGFLYIHGITTAEQIAKEGESHREKIADLKALSQHTQPGEVNEKLIYPFSEKGLDDMLWDYIHELLKQQGYSTGSESDYDELIAELQERKDKALEIIIDGWQSSQPKEEAGIEKGDKQKLIDYIYDFAWNYGRFYHTGDAEEIKKKVSELLMMPEEFVEEFLFRYQVTLNSLGHLVNAMSNSKDSAGIEEDWEFKDAGIKSPEWILEAHFGSAFWEIPSEHIPHIVNAMREYHEQFATLKSSPPVESINDKT